MAEVPWVCRFVSDTTASRTTRLDLNDADDAPQSGQIETLGPEHGFSLGTTEKLVAQAESMMHDGETVTAVRRINRTVVVPVIMHGAMSTFAGMLSAVNREIDRIGNLLEFKPGEHTGESVFFRVKVGSSQDFTLDPNEYDKDSARGLTLSLLCEPVAVGATVSGGGITVSNNPVAATNPQAYTFPAVKGDVDTPVSFTLTNTTLPSAGVTALLNVHCNPGTSARRVLQAETATAGTNTTLQANDTAMSGGGSNHLRITFGSNNILATSRATFTDLDLLFGTYKVLLRVRKTTAGDVFDVRRYLRSVGGNDHYGDTVRYPATTNVGPHWLDLGPLTVPAAGAAPADVVDGVVGSLILQAMRVSGSGSLDVDTVVLVPTSLPAAPKPSTLLLWQKWGGSVSAPYKTGWTEDVGQWSSSAAGVGYTPLLPAGGPPRLHPGHDNHLTLMRHVDTVPGGDPATGVVSADSLTWSTTFDYSYVPKFLYISEPEP